ncbi:MAG: bifunctional DNA-formamidopyrimidine glycosylase/DNA-(apurinic or apyrimidinic site) lyase [Verrucomicrobia bacterium]|nr:bifunctional DNA-formamidopyrimidine glycosylase/DNA-(apurinic or apyrimidinic site) lyase [Verrucomicrobiota bacterium]
MPELPEVETVVRDLRKAGFVGRTVQRAEVGWARTIAQPSAQGFCRRLTGAGVKEVTRRAKYIVVSLTSGDTLFIHLRMTGRLELAAASEPRHKHTHVVLHLDHGKELRYVDPRKFGRWILTNAPESISDALGPEPLEASFTAACFAARLKRHRRMLKPLLLDQSVLAGLGNIYVDEALWDAHLHPCRLSNQVEDKELHVLYRSVRKVLRRGIRSMGTSLGDADTNFYSVSGRRGRNKDGLRVFRRTGEPCPRCATPIERLIVGQRSTHICLACQLL